MNILNWQQEQIRKQTNYAVKNAFKNIQEVTLEN